VWSVLCLVIGGFVLSGIFRGAVQESLEDRLTFDLDGLIAAAEVDRPDHVTLEGRFVDPRFERVFSGWYWQIEPAASPDESQPQVSRSLWDQTLAPRDLAPGEGNAAWGYTTGPDGQSLRVLARLIALPQTALGLEESASFRFLVAGNLADIEADVARFNIILFWSFAAFSIGLILAIAIQVRVGLMPLGRVSAALARIREGRARRLEGEFPAEIAPLAGELNSLIAHSADVVGRARAHVANLAHFLKTPLTVLANEASASSSPLAETVTRQVNAMRRQVDHYLVRARAAGALDVLGSRTDIAPVLQDLARVLKRMHADKDLVIAVEVEPGLAFRGEREDFEEMAGNLVDNACKWAHARIALRAKALDGGCFSLSVGDDGPGLAPAERARAMERGQRLDETVPGTGLGLAIVRDIARLYGGDIGLGQSDLGGLEASLTLPRAA
jgi:signal transduction histidine kinase